MTTSHHVVFDETRFPFLSALSESNLTTAGLAIVDSDGPILIQQRAPCPAPTATDSSGTHTSSSPSSHPATPHSSSSAKASSAVPIAADSPPVQAPATANSPPVQALAATSHPMQTCSGASIYKPNPKYALAIYQSSNPTTISPIPNSVRTALQDPNWRATMATDYDALQRNRTWRLVDRPPGQHCHREMDFQTKIEF